VDQAGLVGVYHCLDPISQPELVEYSAEMGFDGGLGDVELCRDFFVGQADSHFAEDLQFSFGQSGRLRRRRRLQR
jgi:hypothetical protein